MATRSRPASTPAPFAVDYVDGRDPAAAAVALSGARLLYLESPTSWRIEALDVPALATAAKAAGVLSVIDNNWATPIFQNPLALGVDLVVHSASKYLGGPQLIARGKIRLAAMKGDPIAEGLALDVDGNPTTDAAKAFEGVCLPFGGVKGSVLGTLMDLMSGVLTGANFGGDVKSLYFDHSEPQNVGHLFFAIRPDLFMSLTDFEARMDTFYERIKALPRAAGVEEIMMPGEPERRREESRRREGIPVTANVIRDLTEEGAGVGVTFPEGRAEPVAA